MWGNYLIFQTATPKEDKGRHQIEINSVKFYVIVIYLIVKWYLTPSLNNYNKIFPYVKINPICQKFYQEFEEFNILQVLSKV